MVFSVFNSDPEIVEIGYDCVVIYGIALVLSAVNITCTTYNLATERTKNAMYITVLRSISLNCIFGFIMPIVFGIGAVWTGMIVSEVIVICIIGFTYRKKQIREKRLEKTTILC